MELKKFIATTISEYLNEQQNTQTIENFEDDELILYHGSPYYFDKFTTTKMGSGIGQQNSGWGLYLTTNKDSAKRYGKYIYIVSISKSIELKFIEIHKPIDKKLFIKIFNSITNTNIDIDILDTYIDHKKLEKTLFDILLKIDGNLAYLTLAEMIDINNKDKWFYVGNYTANNDKLKHILDKYMYYKKTSFNDFGFNIGFQLYDIFGENGGGVFYNNLSSFLGSSKKASLFLLNNGIYGLKKSINNIRVDYVIFDKNILKIKQSENNKTYY